MTKADRHSLTAVSPIRIFSIFPIDSQWAAVSLPRRWFVFKTFAEILCDTPQRSVVPRQAVSPGDRTSEIVAQLGPSRTTFPVVMVDNLVVKPPAQFSATGE